MASRLEKLRQLGYELPRPPAALAAYVPSRVLPLGSGRSLVWIAGQVPVSEGRPVYAGGVPDDVSLADAQEAARLCALNILAQAEAEGGLEQIEAVLQLTAFVRSANGFDDQPGVANAASQLLIEVLGEAGRHSRIAVGVNALPLGVPVEIAAVLVLRTG